MNSSPTLTATAEDAGRQLVAAVAAATGQAASDLKPLADQYAVRYAEVSAQLAVAHMAGDAAAVTQGLDDLDVLNDEVVEDACLESVNVDAATETAIRTALTTVVGLLIEKAI